jgi:hypothetical protein
VDGPQQPDQRRRRRHQDLLGDAVLDQPRVLCESGLVDAVRGDEHDDELGRRVELALVALGGQFDDVLAGLARVTRRMCFALAVLLRLEHRQVRVERDLGVHHDELPAGQFDEHVRPQRAVARLDRRLLEEIAVGDHAGHLDDIAQLDLAPRPPRRRPLEGGDEVAGLLAQRADALAELADHRLQVALRFAALALEPADLALHAAEFLLHGRDQALDLLGAPGHLAGRALVLGGPRLGDGLRQRGARLGHHVDRDRLQFLAHPVAVRAQHEGGGGAAEKDSEEQQQNGHRDLLKAWRPSNISPPPDGMRRPLQRLAA